MKQHLKSKKISSRSVTGTQMMFGAQSEELLAEYGETIEIEAALKQCVDDIWADNPIEEATQTISREHIRLFIQRKLGDIEDASLNSEEFDKYYIQVDPNRTNKLSKEQATQLIAIIVKF